jgi:hypothetical protein
VTALRLLAVLAAAGVWTADARAHAGHDTAAHETMEVMSCESPPAHAIKALPAPLSHWAVIECSPLGQQLVSAPGWQWRYPASFKVRPVIPAWSATASEDEPGAKYFIALALEPVSGEALAQRHAWLAGLVANYREAEPALPRTLLHLRAENNLGHEFDVWFAEFDQQRRWAVLCVPECRMDYAFRMQPVAPR